MEEVDIKCHHAFLTVILSFHIFFSPPYWPSSLLPSSQLLQLRTGQILPVWSTLSSLTLCFFWFTQSTSETCSNCFDVCTSSQPRLLVKVHFSELAVSLRQLAVASRSQCCKTGEEPGRLGSTWKCVCDGLSCPTSHLSPLLAASPASVDCSVLIFDWA